MAKDRKASLKKAVFETFQANSGAVEDEEDNARNVDSFASRTKERRGLANPDMMRLLRAAREGSVSGKQKKTASDATAEKSGSAVSSDRTLYEDVPVDWCIKEETRITSNQPLNWCSHLSSQVHCLGVEAFVKGVRPDKSVFSQPVGLSSQPSASQQMVQPTVSCEHMAEFQKCLLHYRFPATELPQYFKSAVKRINRDDVDFGRVLESDSDAQFMQQRVIDWIEAMCSIYDMLRNGHCPYFYLVMKSTVVLFVAACVGGSENNVRAILSHSTDHLRQRLRDECIEFTFVDEKIFTSSRIRHKYGTLLVNGRSSVHTLFDFLLNNCIAFDSGMLSITNDVPMILSTTAFAHCSIKHLQTRTAEFTMANSSQKMYELVITGPTMPHAVSHLCDVFRQTLGSFNMTFRQALPQSTPLNAFHALRSHGSVQEFATQQPTDDNSNNGNESTTLVMQGSFRWMYRDVQDQEYEYLRRPELDELQHMHLASIRMRNNSSSFEIVRQVQ